MFDYTLKGVYFELGVSQIFRFCYCFAPLTKITTLTGLTGITVIKKEKRNVTVNSQNKMTKVW